MSNGFKYSKIALNRSRMDQANYSELTKVQTFRIFILIQNLPAPEYGNWIIFQGKTNTDKNPPQSGFVIYSTTK